MLEDSRAVAAAAPGYFNPSVIDPLAAAVAALDETLAAEAPDGLAMPDAERPESVEELRLHRHPCFVVGDEFRTLLGGHPCL